MNDVDTFPDDFPVFLRHSDEDTPVPTWKQLTRSTESADRAFVARISRIVGGNEDEEAALAVWNGWPPHYQRSIALLVDKITHEGWLDVVGPIRGWPWEGGFFFWPRPDDNALAKSLDDKSGAGGSYIRCDLRAGMTARLGRWSHDGWKRGWIENDSPMAALHVGIFKDGSAEAHLDIFNPLCVNGQDRRGIIKLPLIGSYDPKLYRLHRKWENSKFGSVARTSANFYHLMRGCVPLSF